MPGSGIIPSISGLHIGKVSQLESDPDGEDRILVQIPIINNEEEGIWARVATLDAGENRGSFSDRKSEMRSSSDSLMMIPMMPLFWEC
jgi:uncharacterized protein involved in type VI secretion and phage assembly